MKLNPISIPGYEVVMHGIYTDPVIVTSCCWSPVWSGLVCMLQSRMISVVIQFCSLGCTNSTTANEDGVHFTAIYDWRTETGTWLYIYVQSRQLSTFLIKLRENLNNYGENMLQTRCRTSVTPIIKTQYGPHRFFRLSSEKLLSCSNAEVEREICRYREIYRKYI